MSATIENMKATLDAADELDEALKAGADPDDEPVVDSEDEVDPEVDSEDDDPDAAAQDRAAMAAANSSDAEEAEVVKKTGLTPLSAILEKCKDCACGSRKERILCPVKTCSLWPFRKGHKPTKSNRKPMSDEAKAASRARFDAMLARRKAERETKAGETPKA